MARKQNELFIGTEYLTQDGTAFKHISLISEFGNVNINKINDQPVDLIGIDLETDAKTAELKLMGVYQEGKYRYYTDNFLENLFMYVKYAYNNSISIAYWNRLDPFVLFKQFLLHIPQEERERSMTHYAKIGGEWNRRDACWKVRPIVSVQMNEDVEFGILNVIRSSIQFYFKHKYDDNIRKIWAFDIAQLYEYGLEREALGKKDPETGEYPNARLSYYSKVDESAHIVDWERFASDKEYREKKVLYSNYLDAKAVRDLGLIIQKEFHNAFGHYPRTLVSQGSLARTAIVALLNDYHEGDADLLLDDVKSIGIRNYHDEWVEKFGDEVVKQVYDISMGAYSGGYIESIRYGTAPKAYYSDIASAYPGIIVNLWDLRDCDITTGNGEPPTKEFSYCFIRGTVEIPNDLNFHSITVKHPLHKNTNIRAVGTYKATYIKEERDYLISKGCKFTDEYWVNIETTGQLSPLAKVARQFIDLRTKLRNEGNSAQHMAKIAVNSIYGILYEAVDTYTEVLKTEEKRFKTVGEFNELLRGYVKKIDLTVIMDELKVVYDANWYKSIRNRWHNKNGMKLEEVIKELTYKGIYLDSHVLLDQLIEINDLYLEQIPKTEVESYQYWQVDRAGYRAGEFFNSIFASYITGLTRLKLAKRCNYIEDRGGKVILLMTDSEFHTVPDGVDPQSVIPTDDWREEKTLGYFEKAKPIYNLLCLGTGRYEYTDDKGELQVKQRGLNSAELHDPDGFIETDFSWANALQLVKHQKTDKINLSVRTLISVGYVLNNKSLTYKDLGKIVNDKRELDIIVGKSKRWYQTELNDIDKLLNGLINTEPLIIEAGIFGKFETPDLTHPILRAKMFEKKCITQKKRSKSKRNANSKAYYKANQNKRQEYQREYYHNSNSKQQRKENYDLLISLGYRPMDARPMSKWSRKRIDQLVNQIAEVKQ